MSTLDKYNEKDFPCQTCASIFGVNNAKTATVHMTGSLGVDVHYCAEHFLTKYPNLRVPMSARDSDA